MSQKRQENFYDGWLYHLFVDPALRKARKLVRRQVKPKSSLIDIGCGTGELVLSLTDSCTELVGVEASHRMWAYAHQRVRDLGLRNVRFIFASGEKLADFPSAFFDYATACMVMHEMEAEQRLPVLREMQRLADTLILVDYRIPPPANFIATTCRFIERLAGSYHYQNYLSFTKSGGLLPLVERLDLSVNREVLFFNRCLHLVEAKSIAAN
ncbi:MAG: class I SAM-dependent methyltransferase [Syntrophobacterales bacterium]|jgi:SAM-dependent methyltransferase